MANENALLNDEYEEIDDESIDLDDLEEQLNNQIEEDLSELSFLEKEKEKITDPNSLGQIVKEVVWEQFINQMAATAGADFIKENNGLTLDLRNEAHIQTTENFANGKIATHNTEINYQERYDEWQDKFQKNEDGSIKTKKDRITGEEKAVLKPNAREAYDKNRENGSATVHNDHTLPVGEIIRDPEAAAHMTTEEQIAFANSEKNLGKLDAAANQSKGDSKMSDWLDSERDGKKPAERFNIDEEELRKRDAEAREEYERLKKEAEKRSVEAGKKSQRAEAKRIGGKAVRTVLMRLLADLVKEIISKLVSWFKSTNKKLKTLISSIKEAITSFVKNLKNSLIGALDATVTTVASAIFGPIVTTIRKAITLIKQGWRSLKEAIAYIKDPANKNKSVGLLLLEVGKIIIAGITAAGAIVLGEVIEKALIAIPGVGAFFAFEIPLLGSLANILGIFLGAVVAGIIGAIVIKKIQKLINKKKINELDSQIINKGNNILNNQTEIIAINKYKMVNNKERSLNNIKQNHAYASEIIKDASNKIFNDETNNDIQKDFDSMDQDLENLLN
ncbi:cation diffusion facilitator transporter [Ruminococcus sp. HUN007]|uniref:cation diffusion facilitator transporter n=1 Tax=Ruminococcus sp. HUN007 TaxID=1514668 RepID=UPI0005D1DDD6|nr:cation diffusion facilitator transporter [Ruminococcus sp. HUN007]